MRKWNLRDIPDLSGKTAIVTGGNTGLGFASVMELAKKDAAVVIGCRRPKAGQEAIHRILSVIPNAKVSFIQIDLTDFESIKNFASSFKSQHDRLDILINNAGVVNLDTLRHTKAGHEMHMATNHYGTFALTGRLFDRLCHTPNARVVTVSSGGAKVGEIKFDDMEWRERPYSRVKAYGDSKFANLLFMHSLQTRFEDAGLNALSVAAHPGLAATERQQAVGIGGKLSKWAAAPIEVGVSPQLRAATDPSVNKRDYYGPRLGIRGRAVKIPIKPPLENELAEQLWKFTEQVTGVSFNTE